MYISPDREWAFTSGRRSGRGSAGGEVRGSETLRPVGPGWPWAGGSELAGVD